MRALLDENVPEELASAFETLNAQHIESLGLKGITNGELLKLARAEYDGLITFDKGLRYQHFHKADRLRILVLRLPDNRKETVLADARGIGAKAVSMSEGEHGEYWP